MKRKKMGTGSSLILILSAVLALGSASVFSQALGDVNNSGSIDIVDALLTAQYYVGSNPQGFIADVADVNCSGAIDIVDALVIAQFYVGLLAQLPCSATAAPTVAGETPEITPFAATPDPTIPPGTIVKIQYKCVDTGTNVTQIRPYINIFNLSSSAIALSDLKVRYYYAKEGTTAEQYYVDTAPMGSSNVTVGAGTNCIEIGFASGAGSIPANGQTGEIQIRFNKTDWSTYNQSNDWSFDPTKIAYADWDRIPVYRSGALVWGIPWDGSTPEPTEAPTEGPPTSVPTPSPDITPSPDLSPGPTPGAIPTPGTTSPIGAAVIRLNQAGYATDDDYKTAVVAGTSGTFTIYDAGTGAQVFTGTLTSLGTDSGTSETLYVADFSSLKTVGTFYMMVGSEPSPKFEIRDDLYNKVLYYTLRVYGANRCGDYNSWIHAACHTKDGSIRGTGKEGSLTGGWHDCGDHVKFGGTLGYALAMMLYGYVAFPEKYNDAYGSSYDGTYTAPKPDGIPDVINEAKVGTDYLLNLYNASVADGLITQNKMYYQVGDGDDDHSWWNKPELQDAFPQTKGGAPREVWSDIGSDIAGRFSASLAMMYLVYGQWDPTYAANCLTAAKALYDIGKNLYGKTGLDSGGKSYYSQDYRADDDMAFAGVMLYKATGLDYYINNTTGTQYWMAVEQKWQFQSFYVLSFPNVFALALHAYYPYAATVDNDPAVIDTQIVTKDECIEWLKGDVNKAAPTSEIYGRKWDYGWGTCRYMMGVAATAILAYSLDPTATDMLRIAKDQMNWIFGRNQFGMSFVVGNSADNWLTKYPLHPHHRAANPDGANVPELPTYSAQELTGATIGGPGAHTSFSDKWDDYTSTESGIDYWAGTFFTAAFFAK